MEYIGIAWQINVYMCETHAFWLRTVLLQFTLYGPVPDIFWSCFTVLKVYFAPMFSFFPTLNFWYPPR